MREVRGTDIANVIEPGRMGFGTAALVVDEYGVWPWFRRDYEGIRSLVELGWNLDWDYAFREDR